MGEAMLIGFIVFLPFLWAVLSALIGRREEEDPEAGNRRDVFCILACGLELVLVLFLPRTQPEFMISGILTGNLTFTTDGFRIVYAAVTAVMWFFTTAFAKEYFLHERENLNRYWFFVLVTLGATEGVMLSGDFMTSFVFFEILSFTSFTWVIHEETKEAIRAGYTYLFIAVIGGLILFMGLAMLNYTAKTLSFAELPAAVREADQRMVLASGICILLGFGAKAGMFPLHIWLPKAHPVAPSPASALLSGILTKVGVYGILMTSLEVLSGNRTFGLLVLVLGLITMVLGAVLALFSVNLKRTLACSSMSQIGFILTGISMTILLTEADFGEGRMLALAGTMLHMVNHSLIKLTLFMAAGVVVMNLHALTLDDIRGWGRNKQVLKAAFALGALGISGVPFFNGYISKTLLHEGIVEGIHHCAGLSGYLHIAEWVFLFSGGITFCYMLKIFIAVFMEENRDRERQQAFDRQTSCMNPLSMAAIGISSLAMPILGQPAVMLRLAAYMTSEPELLEFKAFTAVNLKGGFISLGIGAILYLTIVRHVLLRQNSYVNLWPAWLDLENILYRPALLLVLPEIGGRIAAVFGQNRILAPFGKRFLEEPAGKTAELLGENRILSRLADSVMFAASFIGRLLVDGMDAFIVFMRMTLVREMGVQGLEPKHHGRLWEFRMETKEAAVPIARNFTFALLMTCLGILLILGALLYSLLL